MVLRAPECGITPPGIGGETNNAPRGHTSGHDEKIVLWVVARESAENAATTAECLEMTF